MCIKRGRECRCVGVCRCDVFFFFWVLKEILCTYLGCLFTCKLHSGFFRYSIGEKGTKEFWNKERKRPTAFCTACKKKGTERKEKERREEWKKAKLKT